VGSAPCSTVIKLEAGGFNLLAFALPMALLTGPCYFCGAPCSGVAYSKTGWAGVVQLIQEAIELHLRGLQEQGECIPPALSTVEIVSVAA